MPFFVIHGPQQTTLEMTFEELEIEIRKEIQDKITNQDFRTDDDVTRLWNEERVSQLLSAPELGLAKVTSAWNEERKKGFLEARLKVLSILIKLRWNRFHSFHLLFWGGKVLKSNGWIGACHGRKKHRDFPGSSGC